MDTKLLNKQEILKNYQNAKKKKHPNKIISFLISHLAITYKFCIELSLNEETKLLIQQGILKNQKISKSNIIVLLKP